MDDCFSQQSNHQKMGRRPVAQKIEKKPVPPMGGEKQPNSSNPPLGKAGLQSEKANLQHLGTTEPRPKPQITSAGLSSESEAMKCIATDGPRRSKRLLMAVTPPQDEEIDLTIDEITLSRIEETKQKSLEEKVNYLLQQFEEQQRTIEALKPKLESSSSQYASPRTADISCRNLYLDLEKQIETLTDEKHQLALKLEHALGKLEAYENGACVFSEGLDKMKDMILSTNPTKTTETAMNFSSQAFTSVDAGAEATTGGKRKRVGVRKCCC